MVRALLRVAFVGQSLVARIRLGLIGVNPWIEPEYQDVLGWYVPALTVRGVELTQAMMAELAGGLECQIRQ